MCFFYSSFTLLLFFICFFLLPFVLVLFCLFRFMFFFFLFVKILFPLQVLLFFFVNFFLFTFYYILQFIFKHIFRQGCFVKHVQSIFSIILLVFVYLKKKCLNNQNRKLKKLKCGVQMADLVTIFWYTEIIEVCLMFCFWKKCLLKSSLSSK